MVKVQVLMSTYNGEEYLQEQIESILNQKGNIKLSILIRDDGSTDNTIKILKKYSQRKEVTWYSGKNLGCSGSFIDLIKKSNDADYYAFADQDDFWEKNKIESAISKLENEKKEQGQIYYSALKIVDKDLEFKTKTEFKEEISFKKGMVRNQATGCTMVFNKFVRNYINNHNFDYICMHDSLVYRLALLFNWKIVRDNNSYILYRQHDNNVLGMSYNKLDDIKKKVKRFFTDEREVSLTATELLKIKNIEKDKKDYMMLLSNYRKNFFLKIKLFFSNDYKSGILISDFIIKIKILINRL